MLTISKPLSASQAQSYHRKEFTSRDQNYWSQRGEIAGQWQGRLAERLGLSGPVSEADFARLSQGQHPETAEQLVKQRGSYQYEDTTGKNVKTMEHRAGWDATFSAPKSVSITALVGADRQVRQAHRDAVTAALKELERYTQARIGGNHLPETTGKFIVAKFEHDTARPVDGYVAPQLHTHAVVFNITERDNGETRALQTYSLFASQQFATAIYQSELTYRLRHLGYEITAGRSGAPEIKGYTQEYLDASSPRGQQIREYLERTGRSGSEAAEIAAHSTRDRKGIHSTVEVMAAHQKLAADFGHQAEAVVHAAKERMRHQQNDLSPERANERVRESVTFSRDKNFEREAVVDERLLVRDALRRGMGDITYSQVRVNLESRATTGEFQAIDRANIPGHLFTTAKTIEAEQETISRMREGQNQLQSVLSRPRAVTVADQYPHLNSAQKNVVEDVLSSPDRIHGIQGVAGAGKTTTLAVIRQAVEAEGYHVEGFAPTSRAAKLLREAGIEASTLQSFLSRSAQSNPSDKRFYFVDESSLASTRQMRDFFASLGSNDRVLLIGDIRQHQGVEAGRPFEQMQGAGMRTAKLDQIVRQKDPTLKSAVELLAQGRSDAAINELRQQGRVQEIPGREERIRTIAQTYATSSPDTLIVSPDNASRRELNLAVRQELRANGKLAQEDHPFRVLVQRQDMTGADRAWANHYEIGDIVRYSRGSGQTGIEAGSYANVVGIQAASNLLTVEREVGESTTYDPRRLMGVSVYREVAHEFAVGDRVQFTAPDKSLGVANRDLAIIQAISSDGGITARVDGGRLIEFNATEHRHFDHGYAVTSHSSQGLTAERVLIHADTSVYPDLLNSRFGYVSVSRASHEATIFTDDVIKLGQHLGAEVSKTSALEINQNPVVSHGFEISL
jgi:conjugative relaxase-like TrwC/TraI family protein